MRKDAAAAIEHDLWFNPHLGPNFATDDSRARSHAVISVPLLAVKEHDRKRRLRSKAVNAFFREMIPVLSNLIVHYLRGSPGNGVPVPLSNQQLGKKGDRYDPLSFPRSFPQILNALRTLGFAEVVFADSGCLHRLSHTRSSISRLNIANRPGRAHKPRPIPL